jgi:hypothetical protein
VVYSNRPINLDSGGFLEAGESLEVWPGFAVLTRPDGQVLSVQPNGGYETRPAGTAGEYEVAEVAGDKRIYRPAGQIHVVWVIG